MGNWDLSYQCNGDTITFYGVDTLEKREKLIKAYDKIVKGKE